jgi:hypothetical protein
MEERLPKQIEKDESLPFRIMDSLDDEMIIQELEGRLPEILTYHFKDRGQEIWGLSKAGVDEAKGELARQGECIRELEANFVEKEEEVFFTVKAGRYIVSRDGKEILLDTAFGFKRQSKKFPSGAINPFWFEQSGIKAARNASLRLIPKSIVQAVIEHAKQKGKVKDISDDDMAKFKKESEVKFAEYHDRIMKIENIFELKNWWKKHYQEMKDNLLPEHFTMLVQLKDELKTKFEETK